jgi:hypothetical protein
MVAVQVSELGAGRPFEWVRDMVRRLPAGPIVMGGVDRVDRLVDQVPVLAWCRARVYDVEAELLLALRDRLALLDTPLARATLIPFTTPDIQTLVPALPGPDTRTPSEAFAALLHVAEVQSPAEARQDNLMRLIDSLLPDEARIILAMADGSQHAVLQAYEGDTQIIANRSSVGRAAKVRAQEMTSEYVTHLLALDLVELVPYEGRSFYEWELIESETDVRAVLAPFDHRKVLRKPKLTRQLLRLSETGRAFCELCIPS